jgi:hypothetical protein
MEGGGTFGILSFAVVTIIAVFNKVGVTAFFGQNQNFASLIALKVILL